METQDSQNQTVEKVLCFASEMILAIMNHEICRKVSIKSKNGEYNKKYIVYITYIFYFLFNFLLYRPSF
jgi:hypothetical protein